MAIYVLSVKHKAKGRGASALAHATYVAREGKYAERGFREEPELLIYGAGGSHAEYLVREGKHQRREHELEYIGHGNMPEWSQGNPMQFWNAADIFERANGRVYTEILVALPRELSRHERQELVRDFVGDELGDKFVYTVAIHNPKALDGGEQPHAHIMFSNRELDGIEREKEQFFKRANPEHPERGGAKKNREWSRDERANNKIEQLREAWEQGANRALEKAGHELRIDRRSLKEQGIEREPEPKMGPEVTQRLKRGLETETGERVLELRNYRQQEKEMEELEQELGRERARIFDFEEEKRTRRDEFSFGGRRRDISEEERQRYRRTVDLVLTRHEREDGDLEYRWKKSGTVAFVDKGDRILFNSVTPTAVKAALQVAQEKGWDVIHATGSEEFRREAWMQAGLMEIKLTGFEARKADLERLEELKKEQVLKQEQYREAERSGLERDGPDYEPERRELPKEMPLTDEKEQSQEQSDQERQRELNEWVKASAILKAVERKIRLLREQGDLKKELDDYYRQKYDLKQLGNELVEIENTPEGKIRLKDREQVHARAQELERAREKERDMDRGR